MTDLIVVVPSRDRPAAVAELAEAFSDTCIADTQIVRALDRDSPQRHHYMQSMSGNTRVTAIIEQDSGTMVSALNHAAGYAARQAYAVGFMGDDHRPRTHGWDKAYLDALRELGTGIVYGNDLLQGENLPTQVAMTADIIKALGYMAPPNLTHMFVDNFWRDLGRHAGCLRYLPDVIVEHLHPVAGKAEWDEGYRRVNAPGVYAVDGNAYADYQRTRMWTDVHAVRALR
jgi:hypothetical protein